MSARTGRDVCQARPQLRPMVADRGAPASFGPSQSRRGHLSRLTACGGQSNLLGASIIWIVDATDQSVPLQPAENEIQRLLGDIQPSRKRCRPGTWLGQQYQQRRIQRLGRNGFASLGGRQFLHEHITEARDERGERKTVEVHTGADGRDRGVASRSTTGRGSGRRQPPVRLRTVHGRHRGDVLPGRRRWAYLARRPAISAYGGCRSRHARIRRLGSYRADFRAASALRPVATAGRREQPANCG